MEGSESSSSQTREKGSTFIRRGGASFPHNRLVLLCLGLLDVILLLTAIVLGVYCIQESKGSFDIPQHLAGTPVVIEFNYLKSNHSTLLLTEKEARMTLEKMLENHQSLKDAVQHEKALNDELLTQIENLKRTKTQVEAQLKTTEESCGRCPIGWTFQNTSCYFFSNAETKKNWPDSREDCKSRDADLVIIDSWEEQEFLTYSLPVYGTEGVWWSRGFWIGLTDIEIEGTWVWVNGVTQQAPLYWIPDEPNNHGPQGENCAAVFSNGNPWHTWYDAKCHHHTFNWICEKAPL